MSFKKCNILSVGQGDQAIEQFSMLNIDELQGRFQWHTSNAWAIIYY